MSETRDIKDGSKVSETTAGTDVADSAVQEPVKGSASTKSSSSDTKRTDLPLADEKRPPTPQEAHPAASTSSDEKREDGDKKAVIASTDEKQDEPTDQDAPEDGAAHHVHGISRIILVFGLCATTFIIGLDQMIIATAIPKITTLFKSLEEYAKPIRSRKLH